MEEITLAMLISASGSQDQLLEICQFLFKLLYFIIINIIMSWCVWVGVWVCARTRTCKRASVHLPQFAYGSYRTTFRSQRSLPSMGSGYQTQVTRFTTQAPLLPISNTHPIFFISASTQPKSQPKDAFWEIHRGFHLRKQMAHQSCVQLAGLNPVL